MPRLRSIVVALLGTGCMGGDLRGQGSASPDGQTYLIIADDNGGKCGRLLVDGKEWPHSINRPGRVRPGRHVLACGGEIVVQVDSGQTYRFDYWGP